MTKGDWAVVAVLVSMCSAFIGGMCLLVWGITTSAISDEQYIRVHYWSKHFPEVRLMVETATWEDNKITQSEYNEIKEEATKFLILDARGENDG